MNSKKQNYPEKHSYKKQEPILHSYQYLFTRTEGNHKTPVRTADLWGEDLTLEPPGILTTHSIMLRSKLTFDVSLLGVKVLSQK
jgi:hypothetical protein